MSAIIVIGVLLLLLGAGLFAIYRAHVRDEQAMRDADTSERDSGGES